MVLWTICMLLGVATVAFAPLLISVVVKFMSGYARKFPAVADVVAVITVIIVGAALIAMSATIGAEYHHIIEGKP